MIVVFDDDDGRILQCVNAPDDHLLYYGHSALIASYSVSDETHYVKDGELVPFPPRPSKFHSWDWGGGGWAPDLDLARSALLGGVGDQLRGRLYLPINFGGARFDADAVSRERIAGMASRLMRGDPLPTGWAGWRDYDNVQRWSELGAADVLEQLTALSRAIEDREQQLLVASWAHKAAIAGIESVDAALAYDVTQGWPQ